MKCVLLILLLLTGGAAHTQIITTIAGNDSIRFSGDGGPATAAKLYWPYRARPDRAGNVYIADYGNNRIRKVDTAGIITTIAGSAGSSDSDGGPATDADIDEPFSVAVDTNGNIYLVDLQRIRKINTAGIINTFAGCVTCIPGSGDGGPATAAGFEGILDIAVDKMGNVYALDGGLSTLRKINTAGIITTIAGNGTPGFSGDGGPATAAQLYQPHGVAVDDSGNSYIADPINQRVRKVSTAGIITTIAGTGAMGFNGDGGPAIAAVLHNPYGVAVDDSGSVYIADEYNSRIRKITAGIITTVAGDSLYGHTGDGGLATAAELHTPFGIAVDKGGTLFIADQGNNDVRKVTAPPHIPGVAVPQSPGKPAAALMVYPNPASTILTVTNPVKNGARYIITDGQGRTLLGGAIATGTQAIDIKTLTPGSYIISLYEGDKKSYTKVFIKQ